MATGSMMQLYFEKYAFAVVCVMSAKDWWQITEYILPNQ
jgi:hypothetical protein